MSDNLQSLLKIHASKLEENPYCYFELAYTRVTGWGAWICSNAREIERDRKVIANGWGSTVEEACLDAINSMSDGKEAVK